MKCRIAELNIEIQNSHPATEAYCSGFLHDFDTADIVIPLSPSEVNDEILASAAQMSFPSAESFLAFKKLSSQLVKHDALLMHGVAVKFRNKGIIFTAPSGTGKTTHMLLWKQLFGEELAVINGDKPIIRFIGNVPTAFGSPWCGKEGYSSNISAALTDICFIERAEQNSACRLTAAAAVTELINATLVPKEAHQAVTVLGMADKLLKKCAVWRICCNMDIEAARLASETILQSEGVILL